MVDKRQIKIIDNQDLIVSEPTKMLNIPSAAIHIENDINLVQKKLWFELLYHAFPTMGNQRRYTVTLKRLRELMGWSENTSKDKELKEALRGLNKTVISWNIFGKDEENVWECFSLLAGCQIPKSKGVCIFEFSSFLEDRFLAMGEEAYVKIDLIVSKRFQSKYALSLYCLALDFLIMDIGYSEKKFSIEDLRRYLSITENEYKLTADFNKRIIRPAEEEINKTSDMNIRIEPFKEGKKIVGYKLCMSLKPGRAKEYVDRKNSLKKMLEQNLKHNVIEANDVVEVEKASKKEKIAPPKKEIIRIESEKLQRFFARYKISTVTDTFQEKLKEVQNSFKANEFEHYLNFLVEYAENEYKKGKIKNFSGFFVSLLQDDMQIDNYLYNQEQERKNNGKIKSKMEMLLESKLIKKFESDMIDEFDSFLMEYIDYLEPTFIEVVRDNIKQGFIYDYLIMKQNKGIIDKTLLLNHKIHIRLKLVHDLLPFYEDFGYNKPSFEEWKDSSIDEDYLNNLREEVQKELLIVK